MGSSTSSVGGPVEIPEHEKPVDICAQGSEFGSAFDDIKDIVCSNDIVVFADPSCGYCYNAQNLLGKAGFNFITVNATPGQRQRLQTLTGSGSVPNVWVKGKYIGGCNDGPKSWMGVKKMIDSGLLKKFLK